ncbi:MAG: hypothetical protein FWH35_08255, partial [Treponema sp.]|nr:hypothetical protein [Treponema sp.]
GSSIVLVIPGERRTAALSARGSGIELDNNRIQLDANYGLLFDIAGGSLSAKDSVHLAAGEGTASIFKINNVKTSLEKLSLQSSARNFAAIIEAQNSELVIKGGFIETIARDVTPISLDNTAALVEDVQIRAEGSFSERAVEIRGIFPLVKSSLFYSGGTAKKSEVFSGMEANTPSALSILGNRFSGFNYIFGEGWPLEKLILFNRAYASEREPNIAVP